MQNIKALKNWIDGKCKEVESLFRIGKVDTAHRKIKENFGEKRVNANKYRDKNGTALTERMKKVNSFRRAVLRYGIVFTK